MSILPFSIYGEETPTGENPVWGADSRHIMFTEVGGLYLLDTITSHKSKILDGLGKLASQAGRVDGVAGVVDPGFVAARNRGQRPRLQRRD